MHNFQGCWSTSVFSHPTVPRMCPDSFNLQCWESIYSGMVILETSQENQLISSIETFHFGLPTPTLLAEHKFASNCTPHHRLPTLSTHNVGNSVRRSSRPTSRLRRPLPTLPLHPFQAWKTRHSRLAVHPIVLSCSRCRKHIANHPRKE